MAPNGSVVPRRKPTENQYPLALGVRGRKTGLILPDTGIRDENGLEPMDNLFSSPAKPKSVKPPKQANGYSTNANKTMTSEEDMDMGDSSIPEVEDILEKRASFRLPPRSKSPIKTFLHSAAKRNPSLGPISSPTRGSIIAPRSSSVVEEVRRKLDFSKNHKDSSQGLAKFNKRAGSAAISTNPTRLFSAAVRLSSFREPPSEIESAGVPYDDPGLDVDDTAGLEDEDSFEMVDAGDDRGPEVQDETIEEGREEAEDSEPVPITTKKGKRKAAEAEIPEEPEKKPKRRRAKKEQDRQVQGQGEQSTKKPTTRRSLGQALEDVKDIKISRPRKQVRDAETKELAKKAASKGQNAVEASESESESVEEVRSESEEPVRKPGNRSRKAAAVSEQDPVKRATVKSKKDVENFTKAKAKASSKKPKLATITETDSPEVKCGPPLPRNNRGLVILRRETLDGDSGFQKTRSGRNSIKPLAYWKNESVVYSEDENEDSYGKYLMPRIKEVIRADEVEQPRAARAKSKAPKSKKHREKDPESRTEEEEVEPWELEPGHIYGDIREWNPEDPSGTETSEREEEIALSSAAIITTDVSNGTFKFAKTLTLPFFGSGMVDLPPGTAKKPKNSRKMQMTFFVFYGRVKVTVNDNEFKIGKGGTWQVPRGNFYSIENETKSPARIFFAQGCEIEEKEEDTYM